MAGNEKIIQSLEKLSLELEGKASEKALHFFKVLCSFYNDAEELKGVGEITLENVRERLKELGLKTDPENFEDNSLRRDLNDSLLELFISGDNPYAIAVGPGNALVAQANMASEETEKEPRRVFKTSEITFNLPDELRSQFEEQVELLKREEEKTNKKVQELLEKESELEKERNRLESESLNAQSEFKTESRKLSEKFEIDKKQADEEVLKIKENLEQTQKLSQELLDKHKESLDLFVSSRSEMEESFSGHEALFQGKFDEMTELIGSLTKKENDLLDQVKKERERLTKRDRTARETLEEAQKKLAALNEDLKALKNDRRNIRSRFKEEIESKKKELERDFARRSEYLMRRDEEWEEEENRLNSENEKLRVREQSLAVEVKGKTDQHFKERQTELDKLEAKLKKSQKEIIKQERELERDKEGLSLLLKQIRSKDFNPAVLTPLFRDQEKITKRKKKVLKTIEESGKQDRNEVEEKIKAVETEKKRAFSKFDPLLKELEAERKRLMAKESLLIKREAEEIDRLNQEYEELRNTFEVDQIEKEMALDTREDELFNDEEELFQTRDKLLKEQQEMTQKRLENDSVIVSELEDIKSLKSAALNDQTEINAFLKDFQISYDRVIDLQKRDYEIFKSRIEDIESMASKVAENLKEREAQSRESFSASEEALKNRLEKKEQLATRLEQDLREKMEEYKTHMEELSRVKENVAREGEIQKKELLESVSHYENKLIDLGQAFEELSTAFHKEKEKGRIEIKGDADDSKPLEFDTALAKAEWPLAVRYRLGKISSGENPPHIEDYIYKLSDSLTLWVPVKTGEFQMGSKEPKNLAPRRKESISKPIMIMKYPVTNVEFYRFVNETQYKTEAERGLDAVVFSREKTESGEGLGNPILQTDGSAYWLQPDGKPESLYGKYNHPVTQVTWSDAQAYCEWKSGQMGQKVRLPTETEWEYVARNFGEALSEDFYWSKEETPQHCNIEETGIGDTSPVDYFSESEPIGGSCDLFGNVFEWTADRNEASQKSSLEYKSVRGGSFITPWNLIAPWRRSSFVVNYGSSFLGFRAVMED